MNKSFITKALAFFIIFLFIGVSIQPVFANNLKSDDILIDTESGNDDKSKYVVEIVREDKIIKHSVFLTKEQANNLDFIIDETHTKLDCSKSYEDTVKIFKDTADSLNILGIFPEDISLNQIKSLVTGENRDLDKIKFKSEIGEGIENRFCFVSSNTSNTYSLGPIILLTALALITFYGYSWFIQDLFLYHIINSTILYKLLMIPSYILMICFLTLAVFSIFSTIDLIPVSIGSLITYGSHVIDEYDEHYYPSNGWIYTLGLNGIKSYDGNFYGGLYKIPIMYCDRPNGITGFTGISILKPDDYVFRLGFALHVKIDSQYDL